MDISVIVPLYNEAESLPELAAWIERVMRDNSFSYEVWFIDDGSTDSSWQVIGELSRKNPSIKGVSFRRNYGKSPALNTGFVRAEGDVVITMDADLQDSPDEIPELQPDLILICTYIYEQDIFTSLRQYEKYGIKLEKLHRKDEMPWVF